MKTLDCRAPVLIMGLVILSCQSAVDDEVERESSDEWSARVEISGGITGRGDGYIEIDSDGSVEKVTSMGEICHAIADDDRLDGLSVAISNAHPDRWNDAYIQEGADQFTYTLTLVIAERRHLVEWKDGAELPVDLREIGEAIFAIRRDVACPQRTEVEFSPGTPGA